MNPEVPTTPPQSPPPAPAPQVTQAVSGVVTEDEKTNTTTLPATAPPATPNSSGPQVIGTQPVGVLEDLTKEKPVAGQFGVSTITIHIIRKILVVILFLVLALAVYMFIQSGQFGEWWRHFVTEPIRKMSQP